MKQLLCVINDEVIQVIHSEEGYRAKRNYYNFFTSRKEAGEISHKIYEDMSIEEPEEFANEIGLPALIAWGKRESYAKGSVAVKSLTEWLDLFLKDPSDYWGIEFKVTKMNKHMRKIFGDSCMAYKYGEKI